MKPEYSKSQQIHSLSFSANSSFGIEFPTVAALEQYTTKVVHEVLSDPKAQKFIGDDWTAVWGPFVFSHDPTPGKVVADNTMMLLYSPSQNLLVIAIAGTNIDSIYGWFSEDFAVNKTVAWQTVVGNGVSIPLKYKKAAISQGTNNGLNALFGMKNLERKTLVEFLDQFVNGKHSKVAEGAELAVAGHSLGGALSPTLALYLSDLQSDWNAGGKVATISTYPTAGPTPGEKHFAEYAASVFGSNYVSIYNSIDVVPHAWMKSDMEQIPTLYEPEISNPAGTDPEEPLIGTLTAGAYLNALNDTAGLIPKNTYTQIEPRSEMTGTFSNTTDEAAKKLVHADVIRFIFPKSLKAYSPLFVNFVRYLFQLGYQHTTAYHALLDIDGYMVVYGAIVKANKPDKAVVISAATAALRHAPGLDLNSVNLTDLETAVEQASQEETP